MKVARPKTESYHNYAEGDCGKPIARKGIHLCFFKKGDWKKIGRKKFFITLFKTLDKTEQNESKT